MLMSTISHLLCAWFAFLLPCFSTFKALSHRPLSEPELERWSMYWAVIGAFLAFENVAEWLIFWLPFYWEIKTIFILFLALPQTQGSTLIYQKYLQPFFVRNEADLDAGITAVQHNAFSFMQTRLSKAWDIIFGMLKKIPNSGSPAATTGATGTQPSALPWEAAMGIWNQYGPSLMSAFQPTRSEPASQASPSAPAAASSTSVQSGGTSPPQYRASFPSTPSGLPPSIPFPEPQHFQ